MERTRRARDARPARLSWGLFLEGRSGGIAFGLILMGVGVVLLLEQQGLIPNGFWRHGWPWIIVLLAVIQLATARSAGRVRDGVTFALIGGWMVMVESHWRGLTWANSWPLVLAAIGAGNSMIPLSACGVVARLCFLTTLTPSTVTRNRLG